MRVGTWNVAYAEGVAKNRLRLERLARADADIWVLTETHDRLDLKQLGYAATSTPASRKDGGRWVTVWSRFPLTDVVPTADADRTIAVVVEAPTGLLVVYGTVLPWHSDRGAAGSAKNWVEHHRTIPVQGAEWARLAADRSDACLIVAGDLNTTIGTSTYYGTRQGRQLLSAALDGAGLQCATSEEHQPPGLVEHPFIDHICVPRRLADTSRIVDAWDRVVDGVRLSDHSAVVVEVEGHRRSGLEKVEEPSVTT